MKVRVGTRGSKLALRQTEGVLRLLRDLEPSLHFEIRVFKTTGDKVQDWPLSQLGGKGFFVREIEEALLEGEIDLAVHSLKDLPTSLPKGLVIGAIPPRADPRDAIITRGDMPWKELPRGAVVGTSSLRRQVQLKALLPEVEIKPLRGNLDTRLRKLKEGSYDAIVVALSGLERLGIEGVRAQVFEEGEMLPAPGQGALAVECREDWPLRQILSFIHHEQSAKEVLGERAFLEAMGGGCQVPLGALGRWRDGVLELKAMVSSLDGKRLLKGEAKGGDPLQVGQRLAHRLKGQGAWEILQEVYGHGRKGLLPPL